MKMYFINQSMLVAKVSIAMDRVNALLSGYPNSMTSNPSDKRTKLSFCKFADLPLLCWYLDYLNYEYIESVNSDLERFAVEKNIDIVDMRVGYINNLHVTAGYINNIHLIQLNCCTRDCRKHMSHTCMLNRWLLMLNTVLKMYWCCTRDRIHVTHWCSLMSNTWL